MRPCRRRLLVALGLWPAAVAGAVAAELSVASEAQVKAAYLVKFPGFVDWPSQAFRAPGASFVIGVAAAEAVLQELQPLLQGRRLAGRNTELRRIGLGAAFGELQMLFVGAEARRDGPALLAACRELPVLTVTEAPWGPPAGAMLNFVQRDGRVRFEAAPAAGERVGVKLSARLLGVAERIVEPAS